ncbi:hypothetical protein KSF78_0006277 [Schistosoma japonicum]|nr:hypothetical protein KSF78_0006277 [Schistosoma japonicum]
MNVKKDFLFKFDNNLTNSVDIAGKYLTTISLRHINSLMHLEKEKRSNEAPLSCYEEYTFIYNLTIETALFLLDNFLSEDKYENSYNIEKNPMDSKMNPCTATLPLVVSKYNYASV